MEKIRVENLTKIFGHQPKAALRMLKEGAGKDKIFAKTRNTVAVNNASFSVNEGEIIVIMGLSGSGKSTLVRCLNRLIEPTSGNIIIDGVNVLDLDENALRHFRQQHLGMVFQNFALFPHRTVCENVEFGLEVRNTDPAERHGRALKALEQVGLKGQEDQMPAQLSGGMQQRVGLARALALDPDIMLMDEAFSALDPLIRRDMQDELLTLQDEMQKTIVFISHDLDEAIKLGDRIVLMKDGAIVQVGTAEEILTNPADDYVARFVEDVDMTKVINAESVMKKVEIMAYYKTDGPKAALRKMQKAGITKIFVRKGQRVVGLVTADNAVRAAKRGDKTLDSIIDSNIRTVSSDTSAIELFPLLAESNDPVAVIDENERMQGIVNRATLLGAIADTLQIEENGGQDAPPTEEIYA